MYVFVGKDGGFFIIMEKSIIVGMVVMIMGVDYIVWCVSCNIF